MSCVILCGNLISPPVFIFVVAPDHPEPTGRASVAIRLPFVIVIVIGLDVTAAAAAAGKTVRLECTCEYTHHGTKRW